jgi:multidrug efflux pump subunit AcrA (membrane-fusion protein)
LLAERLVLFENGKRFVEVLEGQGDKTRKVEVQTGLSDGLNIEILSGVREGDKVVERPPREIK